MSEGHELLGEVQLGCLRLDQNRRSAVSSHPDRLICAGKRNAAHIGLRFQLLEAVS